MSVRLNPYVYGITAVVLFLGVIYGSKALGLWNTSHRVTASGEQITIDVKDVDTVKGSMTFNDVSKAFGIPPGEIFAAMKLPADTPPSKRLKDVMHANKMEVDDLRDWLKKRAAGAK